MFRKLLASLVVRLSVCPPNILCFNYLNFSYNFFLVICLLRTRVSFFFLFISKPVTNPLFRTTITCKWCSGADALRFHLTRCCNWGPIRLSCHLDGKWESKQKQLLKRFRLKTWCFEVGIFRQRNIIPYLLLRVISPSP